MHSKDDFSLLLRTFFAFFIEKTLIAIESATAIANQNLWLPVCLFLGLKDLPQAVVGDDEGHQVGQTPERLKHLYMCIYSYICTYMYIMSLRRWNLHSGLTNVRGSLSFMGALRMSSLPTITVFPSIIMQFIVAWRTKYCVLVQWIFILFYLS
jgi:hypothetical protein